MVSTRCGTSEVIVKCVRAWHLQTGKLDDTCWTLRSCSTTDFRSPCESAAPSSEVNFFCWTARRCDRGSVCVSIERS